jgi:predicted aspartyl protease
MIAIAGLMVISSLSGLSLPWQAAGEESAPAVVRAGEHRLPFQLRNGLIYIQARVNGERATLLVDTGAALTIFTLRVVPTLNTDSQVTINMAKGSVSPPVSR